MASFSFDFVLFRGRLAIAFRNRSQYNITLKFSQEAAFSGGASSAGLLPGGPYMSTYYATKAYVTSLTNAIYQELQEVHSNVHISMLCPGPVNTNFNETANVTFALPGISAKRCVSYCLKEMSKGTLTIVPSPLMRAAVWGSRFTPKKILLSILSKQQKKKGY